MVFFFYASNLKLVFLSSVQGNTSTTIGLRNNLSTINCINILSTENIQSTWSEKISVVSDHRAQKQFVQLRARTSPSGWTRASRSLPQSVGGPQTAARKYMQWLWPLLKFFNLINMSQRRQNKMHQLTEGTTAGAHTTAQLLDLSSSLVYGC